MPFNPEIKQIIVKYGEIKIYLSSEEAKGLKKALEELFPDPIVHHDHFYPWWADYPYRRFTITANLFDQSRTIRIYDSNTSHTF